MDATRKMRPEWIKSLGARINKLRCEKGWSQEAVAADAKISRTQLAHIELGDSEAKIGTLRAIARALETTVSEMVKEIEGFDK